MPLGPGTSSGNANRAVNRRSCRILRRSSERKNPIDLQFERRVAELEAKHQERRCILTFLPLEHYLRLVPPVPSHHVENGNDQLSSKSTPPVDSLEPPPSPPVIFLPSNVPDESHKGCSDNSSRPSAVKSTTSDNASNSDFLVNCLAKTTTNVKQTARKKSRKKNKKHKRVYCRKPSNGSETQRRGSKNAYPAIDISGGGTSTVSPKLVADIPFEDAPSSSDSVKEVIQEAPDSENDSEQHDCLAASISSTSCSEVVEQSRSTILDLGFCEEFSSSNCSYLDNFSNSIIMDSSVDVSFGNNSRNCSNDTKTLLIVRNERECAQSELTDPGISSNGVHKDWLDKSGNSNSLCYPSGVSTCNRNQAVQLCSNASEDDDFHPVIYKRKSGRKRTMSLLCSFNAAYMHSAIDGQNEKSMVNSSIMLSKPVQTRVKDDPYLESNPGMTSFLNLHDFPYLPSKPQNKIDNSALSRSCSVQSDLHAQDASSQSAIYAADTLTTTAAASQNELGVGCGCGAVMAVEGNSTLNSQSFGSSVNHLAEMIKAANDAYEVQVAADVHLAARHPIADFETFMYFVSPVIGQIPCMQGGNCLRKQLVGNSPCHHEISNVSLSSMWEWFEEPSCYGLEVKTHDSVISKSSTCRDSEFSAYFVPSLSAVQLFGKSNKNLDHPELIFEYFESEKPYLRPSLFEKIKELVSRVNPSDYRMLGDPEKLENVKLCDLHPASWFSVAWYPIYRLPPGNFHVAFLTYHSLGKLVPQSGSPDMAGRLTSIVSPVVGLQSYNDKGEQWFQLRDPEFKPIPTDDAPKTDRAEILKERLRTLRHGASVMGRAVIPKGTKEVVNRHPDYEFFLSRSD